MTTLSAPNIVVIGRSGVGKSSLINRVFGSNLAATGAGKPITRYYRRYADQHIVLFDTPGWEPGEDGEAAFYADTQTFLQRYRTTTPTDHIHMVWYTIDAPSARFTDFDVSLVSKLLRNYPVFVVLTKCDVARDDQSWRSPGLWMKRAWLTLSRSPRLRRNRSWASRWALTSW